MKKQDIIPCTLAMALLGVLSASTAFAAKNSQFRVDLPRPAAGGARIDTTFQRFIVQYRDGSSAKTSAAAATQGANKALAASATKVRGQAVTARQLRTLGTGQQLIKTSQRLDSTQAAAFMRQLKLDPNVVSVTVDRFKRIDGSAGALAGVQPAYIPSDPNMAAYQWHFDAPDGTVNRDGGPNHGGANVTAAWDLADGAGAVIAVLDTGITAHPDIDTSLADAGYDFITDSFVSGRATDGRVAGGWDTGDWTNTEPWLSECSPRESSWHGTHVAATAGAEITDNGLGMAGVAYGAKVLPLRVLGHCGGYTSDIVDAIVWAAGGTVAGVPANANRAHVINLSLGGAGACDAVEVEAIEFARSQGASVVISAGNSSADTAGYSPGNCPGVITVASTGVTSRRAFYSNYGAGIEIAAPGGGVYPNDGSGGAQINDGFIWQALNPGTTTPVPVSEITAQNGYGGYAGTSQAAPHVAGTIALMQGARIEAGLPLLTPDETLDILQDTATPFAVAPSASQPIGPGILNAGDAVEAAIVPPCDPDVEQCEPDATPLVNRVPVAGLTGDAGSEALYSFEATAGAVLSIMTYGGSGDVSVYVSFDEEPTTTKFDAKSTRAGNSETVRFKAPQVGKYYIKLVGARAYRNVTLVARQ